MKGRDDRISGPKPFASDAARRIESIIEGAERAAERVIDDAEQQARAYVAESEAEADRAVAERLGSLGELTDALAAQADAIRRQSELLTRTLQEAKDRLGAGGGGGSRAAFAGAGPLGNAAADAGVAPTHAETAGAEIGGAADEGAAAEPAAPRLSAVEPTLQPVTETGAGEPGNGIQPAAEGRGQGTPAGARLLATQMAVSGSSREEIATRLRNGFDIEDTDAILDAILGPEG